MSFPVNSIHRLLLEDNTSYLLLEDGTSKLVLDEIVALDDPLQGATPSLNPLFSFVGEQIVTPYRQQYATGSNSAFASTVSATLGAPMTALANGFFTSTIIITVRCDLVTTSANTPTDTVGNTYARVAQLASTNSGSDFEVWYAKNVKTNSGNVITVTDNGAGVDSEIIVEEWIGLDPTSPFDKTAQAISGGSTTAISSGATATTTGAPGVVLAHATTDAATAVMQPGAGFGNLAQVTTTSPSDTGTASQIVRTLAAYTGLMRTGVAADWGAIVTTWKAVTLLLHYEIEVDTVNTFDSQ